MINLWHDRSERRTLFKYMGGSAIVFLAISFIQFSLIVNDLQPRNIILPMLVATIVGLLLGHNAILRKRLERSNTTKSQFLARMNHELRTPVSAIISFADLLNEDKNLDINQKEQLQRIHGAGSHLLKLINELLEFARLETGRITINRDSIVAYCATQEAIDIVMPLSKEKGVKIEHKYDGFDRMYVFADEMRLKQIMINLLSNAIKYNRVDGTVTVSYLTDNRRLHINVMDSGLGIPEEKLSELFEPFNRLGAENTSVNGTGIGLTISKALVEMMGGEIRCDSNAGLGTTFTISLPCKQTPAQALISQTSE